MGKTEKYIELIKKNIYGDYKRMFRDPDGSLEYPFIVPGSTYDNTLWDWDSWLTCIALHQITSDLGTKVDIERILPYEKGCIQNFRSRQIPERHINRGSSDRRIGD
jgi:putative isomerase